MSAVPNATLPLSKGRAKGCAWSSKTATQHATSLVLGNWSTRSAWKPLEGEPGRSRDYSRRRDWAWLERSWKGVCTRSIVRVLWMFPHVPKVVVGNENKSY